MKFIMKKTGKFYIAWDLLWTDSIVYDTPTKFIMKGTIEYKIINWERGKIQLYQHQIEKYLMKPLKFPSLKDSIIGRYHKKPGITFAKKNVL